jgi:hypothetical protein
LGKSGILGFNQLAQFRRARSVDIKPFASAARASAMIK